MELSIVVPVHDETDNLRPLIEEIGAALGDLCEFATDQIHNIHDLSAFLADRGIAILDLSTSRYPAPFTGSPLFLAHLIVRIPAGTRIVSLRDEFLDFCDQLNLDALLEPVKR